MVPNIVIVSNRGPSFAQDLTGKLVVRRAPGGLVSILTPLVKHREALWIAAALNSEDRKVAQQGPVETDGFQLRLLALDSDDYRQAYDVISNTTLWFLHHNLYDLARVPHFDRKWRQAWAAYQRVNQAFAWAIADEAPAGATVLVQDYHLALVGAYLVHRRDDLQLAHFHHTPFCSPDALRVLPDDVAKELMESLARYGACGFNAHHWAQAFEACCHQVLGEAPSTFVIPSAPSQEDLAKVVASEDCARERQWVEEMVGDRRLVLRVDRIELSKNLLRGFLAFDDLLRTRPAWRGQVIFCALAYPSRANLPQYVSYRQQIDELVSAINSEWGTPEWTPIVFDTSDNFPRSVAALERYDVLLVNPVRDGLNLVAKEGPLINTRDGVLALSREAGVWEELGSHGALEVNPFDVMGTADLLGRALELSPEERAARAAALRRAAGARTPSDWIEALIEAARQEREATG